MPLNERPPAAFPRQHTADNDRKRTNTLKHARNTRIKRYRTGHRPKDKNFTNTTAPVHEASPRRSWSWVLRLVRVAVSAHEKSTMRSWSWAARLVRGRALLQCRAPRPPWTPPPRFPRGSCPLSRESWSGRTRENMCGEANIRSTRKGSCESTCCG